MRGRDHLVADAALKHDHLTVLEMDDLPPPKKVLARRELLSFALPRQLGTGGRPRTGPLICCTDLTVALAVALALALAVALAVARA